MADRALPRLLVAAPPRSMRYGSQNLWLQSLDRSSASVVEGSDGASGPFWSPDSRFVAFRVGGQLMKTRATEEWLQILDEAGVPCGPVLTLEEVYEHPQVKARAMDSEVQHPIAGHIHQIGFPVKYSSTPGQMYRPAPVLGQHTFAMLESLGFSPEQCRQLESEGIIFDAHLKGFDAH